MEKRMKHVRYLVSASLLLGGVVGTQVVVAEDAADDYAVEQLNNLHSIDKGIFDLDYKKDEVLSAPGETIESFVPREGILHGDQFIVVEREKKMLGQHPIDISIIDSMIDRTYPGAIQLADQDFLNNMPNLVSVRRAPLNLSIDLPGMQRDNTIEVKNPTYGNVKAGIDELLAIWSDKHSATHTLPARMQYNESMVHSRSQIQTALNIHPNVLNNTLGIDFHGIEQGDKQTMVSSFKQIYYTVSAEKPHNPSDLFDERVTYRDLTRRGVSAE